MSQKKYCIVSAVLFTIIAIAHLARLVFGWPVTLEATVLPVWLSGLGFVIATVLAYYGFKSAK